MMFHIIALLVGITAALSKGAAKIVKSPPYITNSLVNLGKMDISFYLNSKDQGKFLGIGPVTDMLRKMDLSTLPNNANFMFQKPTSQMDEPCPCSILRNYKDSNPSAVLNKILSSNDLFSYKNPMSSVLCCDSHEDTSHQDESVFLEFGTKPASPNVEPSLSLPPLPYLLESFLNKEMPLSPSMVNKPKTIEILFFPKNTPEKIRPKSRYTTSANPITNIIPKKELTISDKSIEKEFKIYDEKADVASVKKDLKGDIVETKTTDIKESEDIIPKENNHL